MTVANEFPDVAPARVLAHLVTDFCLPVIMGQVQMRPPAVPQQPLGKSERAALGFTGEGRTTAFRLASTDVFLDLAGIRSLVWFVHDQAKVVHGEVEKAVLSKFPVLRLMKEGPLGSDGLQQRIFVGDLSETRRAQVEFAYPAANARCDPLLSVRVLAFSINEQVLFEPLPNPTTPWVR